MSSEISVRRRKGLYPSPMTTARGRMKRSDGLYPMQKMAGQIVITGEETAVLAASAKLQEAGAKRCVPLKVSGPFHSALLAGAGEKLAKELEGVKVCKPAIPYICNVEASYVTESEPVKELLVRQVSGTVRWRESMERMLADGVDTFIEIGPGKTLAGFLKKIKRDVKVVSIGTVKELESFFESMSE